MLEKYDKFFAGLLQGAKCAEKWGKKFLSVFGGAAGLTVLILMMIGWCQGIDVQFSDYWAISHKVETLHGISGCAWFDTITLPLTFYNTGLKYRAVGMLKLRIKKDGQVVGEYEANREYARFDEEDIMNWQMKGFYVNAIVAPHSSIFEVVEFYPDSWQSKGEFILKDNEEYDVYLYMKSEDESWKFMGQSPIATGEVSKLKMDPAICQDQVDVITY